MQAEAWGVAERYQLASGEWCDAPPETVAAVLSSMGAEQERPPPAGDRPLVVHPGQALRLDGPGRVTTENGAEVDVEDGQVPELPLGYHAITRLEDGHRTSLIVSPGLCRLPDRRGWGWAVQLYAARSRASWGMGDLADLRRLASWSAQELGANLVLLNPLHAALPGLPQTASPYFPSSRRYRNPLYLRVEDVPGAGVLGQRLEGLAADGRALNADRRIDRDAVHRLKMDALEQLWDRFGGDPAFDAYRAAEGSSLEGYATFCALAEEHGRPWDAWPDKYRHPDTPAVAGFRKERGRRVAFHQWLQWLLDEQLRRAAEEAPLIQDLAVGVDPAGADAWLWQDVMARDMAVGAPPDEFNTQGQDWGVPPFDPWRLRAAGYEPFIQTIRAALRHSGGMRLDHVMGLFRLFWVPRGASPTEGTYVHYPAGDLLDIVALESHRARAYVVGEDLGTVEEQARAELAARNVLSYRLLWFERQPPEAWPVKALAAVTTHDLPTVAGLWESSDLEAQRSLDLHPNEEATAATRSHLRSFTGEGTGVGSGDGELTTDQVVTAAYAALAKTPCLLLAGTLDDALGVEERPNMPGTTDQWPNWSIALPVPLEDVEEDPGPRRVASSLRRDG